MFCPVWKNTDPMKLLMEIDHLLKHVRKPDWGDLVCQIWTPEVEPLINGLVRDNFSGNLGFNIVLTT